MYLRLDTKSLVLCLRSNFFFRVLRIVQSIASHLIYYPKSILIEARSRQASPVTAGQIPDRQWVDTLYVNQDNVVKQVMQVTRTGTTFLIY